MIDKELFKLIGGNQKYIFIAVLLQAIGLIANVAITGSVCYAVYLLTENSEAVKFVYPLIGAAIGTSMVLQARKIAVTCKPLFHQGRGLSKNKIARLDFEKKCGVHRFCSDTPCCVVKIDPHENTRENGRFREISPVFSPLLFFEKIPIHFAIFSDRKDLNPRKRDFQKKAKPN